MGCRILGWWLVSEEKLGKLRGGAVAGWCNVDDPDPAAKGGAEESWRMVRMYLISIHVMSL